jgi:16S rRNA processing protein RimM
MLRELPADTYYIKDLIGMEVVSLDEGRIGVLSDIIQNSSQDLYEVLTNEDRKIYIPAVEEFIREIDCQNRKITVKLIEGLLEL